MHEQINICGAPTTTKRAALYTLPTVANRHCKAFSVEDFLKPVPVRYAGASPPCNIVITTNAPIPVSEHFFIRNMTCVAAHSTHYRAMAAERSRCYKFSSCTCLRAGSSMRLVRLKPQGPGLDRGPDCPVQRKFTK